MPDGTQLDLAVSQPGAFPLALYDAMCRAIDAAYEIDEVKDIRDRALAFETYARLAGNIEAERRACEIRLRAERKAGALDKKREKAKASGANQHQERFRDGTSPPTLRDLGVSKRQVHDWRKLDEISQRADRCAAGGRARKGARRAQGRRPRQEA